MSTPRTFGARSNRRASTSSDSHAPGTLADWMERYVAGDRRAFAALYRAIEPRVRRQIRARVGNHLAIDDLVQYTMLRAHAARARYLRLGGDADESLVAWYCAIARNVAHNFMRSSRRDRLQLADDGTLDAVQLDAEDLEQQSVAREVAQERRAALLAAIAALPPGQRVVVRMHRLEGLPMAEVSRRLGVRGGAVRVRAHRAYESLRVLITARCPSSRGLAA